MAFVVKRIGKFWIVKIDRKIVKQPIGISKKPHTVLKIIKCLVIDIMQYSFDSRSNSGIPDKFAQRNVSRVGLLGRTLLTVKKSQSEIFFRVVHFISFVSIYSL